MDDVDYFSYFYWLIGREGYSLIIVIILFIIGYEYFEYDD